MAYSAIGMQRDSIHKHAWLALTVVVLAAGGVLANVSDSVSTDTVGGSTTVSVVPIETPATTITTAVDGHVIGASAMPTTVPADTAATFVSPSPTGSADTIATTVSPSHIGSVDTTTTTVSSSTAVPADRTATTANSSPTGPAGASTTTVSSSPITVVTVSSSASVETTAYTLSTGVSGTSASVVPAVSAATPEAGSISSTDHAAANSSSTPGANATVTSQSITASVTATSSGSTKATSASDSTSASAALPVPSTTMLTHSDIIVIAVPAAVCGTIVIVVVVGLATYCHRRQQIPVMRRIIPPMPDRPTSSPPELVKLSKPVNLTDFPEYVKQMSADSCFGFSEEYDDDLKDVGRDQTTIIAKLEHNLPKNRFTNILPYDHSRVKLFTSGGPDKSDYINANYIPGHNGAREFIATQGPMQNTVDDFWRMVWEQQCKAIVMLTRCTEGIVDKCHHYWPSGQDAVTYGNVTVQVTDELEQPHWTVTNFSVSVSVPAAVSDGSAVSPPVAVQSRHIRHFHYTAFPDHRAPLEVDSMLQFTRMVRSKLTRSPGGGPIVVHCSAGVGRSGTYIAIDRVLQQIEDGCSSVDVFGIVREMRLHRMYMVQAEEQYVFIHQIIERELQQRSHAKETPNGKGIENAAFAGE